LIIGALEFGARRGELLGLQWADVDRERSVGIRAENAKDGEHRILPISHRPAGVFETAEDRPGGKEYGGSRWLEAGWPLHKVRDMLGHATIDQTDT